MANPQTEVKPQGWRAIAVFKDKRQALLWLGRSSPAIRSGYVEAFFEVLSEEDRKNVASIEMQKWHGAADSGRWLLQCALRMPPQVRPARAA